MLGSSSGCDRFSAELTIALFGLSGARRNTKPAPIRRANDRKDLLMLDERAARAARRSLISRTAHVIERIGLAMAGAICGTFVSAYFARAGIESLGFVASMTLVGIAGFYLGIDIPRTRRVRIGRAVDVVELFSATGTFLATMAALTAVYALVLDDVPQRFGESLVGSCWLLGLIMQIGAGALGRWRPVRAGGW